MGCGGSSVAPKDEESKRHSSRKSIASLARESEQEHKNKGHSSPKRPPALTNECLSCGTQSHCMSPDSPVWGSSDSSPHSPAMSDISATTHASRARGRMHQRLRKIAPPFNGTVQGKNVTRVSPNRKNSLVASKDAKTDERAQQGTEVDVMEVASPLRAMRANDCKPIRKIAEVRDDLTASVGQPIVECASRDNMADAEVLVSSGQPCRATEVLNIVDKNIQIGNDRGTELDANRVVSDTHGIAPARETFSSLDCTSSSLGRGSGVGSSCGSTSSVCNGSGVSSRSCDRLPTGRSEVSTRSSLQTASDTGSILAHMYGHLELLQSQLADLQSEAADLETETRRAKSESRQANKRLPRKLPQSTVKFLIPSSLSSVKSET